ncbi:LysM peptidoglycan-binding domain-containing protein [Paraliobacillus sediminis]|uniref:C40 family peptidase n=1 Tax=Paraliobacillus sediminis TaxID=1885916 RepID=UPI000E3C6EC1|nr:LysM peptidoglycan-binding domain-containing protein [Paraliobacillus sediminis]
MKKTLISLSAGAVIATAFTATTADAATYTVQKGDSLWSIAQKNKTTVTQLLDMNKLSSSIIFPNQKLETTKTTTSTAKKTTTTEKKASTTTSSKATTYKVKSGDSLSKIASAHGITLSNLMKWNDLDSTLIYPNDVLAVSNSSSASTPTKTETKPATTETAAKPANTSTYTVKSGDSLWKIGKKYSVSITALKKQNNLSSDIIRVGQVLSIGTTASKTESVSSAPASETVSTNVDYDVTKLLEQAKSYLGTSYLFGGSNPSAGFDCSGFIYHTYNKAGKEISRLSSDGYYNRSYYVNTPQLGDLVFFENTYRKGISHLGIYVGDNSFIHAGSKGVQITSLDNSYWSSHFEGFKRFY